MGGGECFLILAQKTEGNDKAKGLYAGQARSMLLALIDQYPGSSMKARAEEFWVKAEAELAKVPK